MRLICPNCGARYEVADDVIPKGGRDVQCSSCTKTWYQTDKPLDDDNDRAPSAPLLSPAPPSSGKTVEIGAPSGAATQAAERKPLDSAVAEILRQEAARDGHVNAKTSPVGAPPQTEAAASKENVTPDETRKRIAFMTRRETGENLMQPATPTATGAVAAASGGAKAAGTNLRSVPDIHEINAALRARAEAADTSGLNAEEKREARERKGFRSGFFLVLLLIAILILPYFFAEQITTNLPQTQAFMASYVAFVDQLRLGLEGLFANVRAIIDGFMAG